MPFIISAYVFAGVAVGISTYLAIKIDRYTRALEKFYIEKDPQGYVDLCKRVGITPENRYRY